MRLLPLLLLVVCCYARGDWIPIAAANTGAVLWEYDPERVRRNGNKLELWIKSSGSKVKELQRQMYTERPDLFSTKEVSKFENEFAYTMTRFEVDCKSWEARVLTTSMYDKYGAPFGAAGGSSDQFPIYPDSLIDTTASKLCHSKKR